KWKRQTNICLQDYWRNQYYQKLIEYRARLKEVRQESCREHYTQQTRDSMWRVYKGCKASSVNHELSTIPTDTGMTTSVDETADQLFREISPSDTPHNERQQRITDAARSPYQEPDDPLLLPTCEEVQAAIDNEKDKSPGEDGISANIIKRISKKF